MRLKSNFMIYRFALGELFGHLVQRTNECMNEWAKRNAHISSWYPRGCLCIDSIWIFWHIAWFPFQHFRFTVQHSQRNRWIELFRSLFFIRHLLLPKCNFPFAQQIQFCLKWPIIYQLRKHFHLNRVCVFIINCYAFLLIIHIMWWW